MISRSMRDSGIDWVGKIPEEWKVYKIAQLFKQHKLKNEGLVEQNLLSLSYGKVIRRDFNSTEGKQLLALFNYLSLQLNRHLLFGQVADLKPIKRGHGMMQFDQSLTLIGLVNDQGGGIN